MRRKIYHDYFSRECIDGVDLRETIGRRHERLAENFKEFVRTVTHCAVGTIRLSELDLWSIINNQ